MNIHVDDNNEVLLGVQTDEVDLRAGDTINIGTSDYEELTNKPSIEGVELIGDVSLDDIGAASVDDLFSGDYNDLTNKPTIPSKTSQLTNDSGYITTETDPTVPAWAKAPNKPTYTASEVHALPDTTEIPTLLSDLENDEGFITEDDIPPKVTEIVEYDDYDPDDYDGDIDLICASLCQDDGCYRVTYDGFVYYVFTQRIDNNGQTLLRQVRWSDEEGALIDALYSVTIEDGEIVDISSGSYITFEQAAFMFALINHQHWSTESGADTVWDFCDTSDSKFNTNNSSIIYKDTTNSKWYLIEVGYAPSSPFGKYQRVQPFDDGSRFYQRIATRVGSTYVWESWKEFTDRDSTIFVGTSSTGASTGEKEVVCPEFKSSDLKAGTIITVTFSNANSAAVGDLKLNVNSTGAKNIKVNSSGTLSNLGDKGYLKASTYQFYYSGTYWVLTGYDTNTNTIGYNIRTNALQLPLKTYCGRYRICFTSADGEGFVPANSSTSTSATASKTVTTEKINPWGRIIYYTSTTGVNADGVLGATYMYSQYYTVTLGYSFNRTNAALALTAQKPVYVKCTPNADGSATIDGTTPYTQALPTTNDGSIYIFLGVATAATTIEMTLEHPVYYHDGTRIRLWT